MTLRVIESIYEMCSSCGPCVINSENMIPYSLTFVTGVDEN